MSEMELWTEHTAEGERRLHVTRLVARATTAYSQVEIIDTPAYGRLLALDGHVQSAASDEAVYHEALVAPAFVLAARSPRQVAILGGGEGATLREVLGFVSVERCVMIDIDAALVELCREHMPGWSMGAFEDPRTELRVGDARAWLEGAGAERFDLIIGDLPDPEAGCPLQELYSRQCFTRVRERLAPGGLFVTQAGGMLTTAPDGLAASQVVATARAVFGEHVDIYARHVPSFRDLSYSVIAGLEPLPALSAADIDARLKARREPRRPTRSYDGETHRHMFAAPAELRAALARDARVISDREADR
jgi:spermidine synthase